MSINRARGCQMKIDPCLSLFCRTGNGVKFPPTSSKLFQVVPNCLRTVWSAPDKKRSVALKAGRCDWVLPEVGNQQVRNGKVSFWLPVVPCGSLWLPVVPRGSLWFLVLCGPLELTVVHRGSLRFILVYDLHGSQMCPVIFYGSLWVPVVRYTSQEFLMVPQSSLWFLAALHGSYGFLWFLMVPFRCMDMEELSAFWIQQCNY